MVAVSIAPLESSRPTATRMGWSFHWAPRRGSDFSRDFGVSFTPEEVEGGAVFNYRPQTTGITEREGISVFYKDARRPHLPHLLGLRPRHRHVQHGLPLPGHGAARAARRAAATSVGEAARRVPKRLAVVDDPTDDYDIQILSVSVTTPLAFVVVALVAGGLAAVLPGPSRQPLGRARHQGRRHQGSPALRHRRFRGRRLVWSLRDLATHAIDGWNQQVVTSSVNSVRVMPR